MTTLTKKLNRAELLQLGLNGNVKAGDKFKDERGDVITFTGSEFVWDSGTALKLMVHGNEYFTPVFVDEDVTITLKQSEINSIRVLVGDETISGLQRKKDQYSHPFEIVKNSGKYNDMFDKLQKVAR